MKNVSRCRLINILSVIPFDMGAKTDRLHRRARCYSRRWGWPTKSVTAFAARRARKAIVTELLSRPLANSGR